MRMIKPMADLYEQLRRLPGIGSKTAMRLAYHIVDIPEAEVRQLASALLAAKPAISLCRFVSTFLTENAAKSVAGRQRRS